MEEGVGEHRHRRLVAADGAHVADVAAPALLDLVVVRVRQEHVALAVGAYLRRTDVCRDARSDHVARADVEVGVVAAGVRADAVGARTRRDRRDVAQREGERAASPRVVEGDAAGRRGDTEQVPGQAADAGRAGDRRGGVHLDALDEDIAREHVQPVEATALVDGEVRDPRARAGQGQAEVRRRGDHRPWLAGRTVHVHPGLGVAEAGGAQVVAARGDDHLVARGRLVDRLVDAAGRGRRRAAVGAVPARYGVAQDRRVGRRRQPGLGRQHARDERGHEQETTTSHEAEG